ncbi:MAG: aminotransferase class III-fold pyridoxal phosphate-dependent enzyme [Candidatus Methanoperedens sp.]|nr:aminotransferase class III-fold pyridoxal phosphate-dependent enzyme [Candidatus Methanoperedens sp.]
MNNEKGIRLWNKAKVIIPGGSQLLSKRSEMFLPEQWPSYYDRAKGCQVWDLDGNGYTDMSTMGIGACILGYADDDVDGAVKSAIDRGSMCTLNAPEEIELAELLIRLHPWAQMVRYARTGGEALAMAVRIARAKSGKDIVLFCGYHGWHDWYLSSNLANEKSLDGHLLPGLQPLGVPRALKGTSFPFNYNDTKGFMELITRHKDNVGVIVLEAIRSHDPEHEFLMAIQKVIKDLGIVLIIDEVSSGWRMNLGGAHLLYDIKPDIAVFAKAISNGYPMAAVIGRGDVMEVAQDTFISSTYWTDRIGPTAALATINKMKENDVQNHLMDIGKKVQEGWSSLASDHDLDIEVSGIYPLGHFEFKYEDPLVPKTLFTQLMLEKGFLATTGFYSSYSHKDEDVERFLTAVDSSFKFIAKAIKEGKPEKYLKGPVCHSGFKRLT